MLWESSGGSTGQPGQSSLRTSPKRLVRFKEASGMSWRSMAQLLGVSPYRLREWRSKGVIPGSAHLFCLLTLAESMGLRDGVLMCPNRDLPTGVDMESLSR